MRCTALLVSLLGCSRPASTPDANDHADACTTCSNPDTPASTAGYTTSFPLTENPLHDGGAWITGKATGLDWNDPESTAGHAYASVLSGTPNRYNDSIAHLTATFAADQWAQGTVFRIAGYDPSPGKHEVELLLRFAIAAHDAHGYEVMWGATGYLAVVRWNGPLGDYTTLHDSGDPGIGPAVEGDVLRAELAGTTITVEKNGERVATIDASVDPVWATGQPGLGFWPVDGATIDAYGWKMFEAGTM